MSEKIDISDQIMRLDPNRNRLLRYLCGPPQLTGWRRVVHWLLTSREQLRVEQTELDAFLAHRRRIEAMKIMYPEDKK